VLTRCGLRRERAKAGVVGAQPDQLGSWAILRSPIVSYFGTVESGCGVEPMCGEELEMFHPPSPPRPLFRAHRSCRPLQRRPLSVRYSSPVSRLGRWNPQRGWVRFHQIRPPPYITPVIPLQWYCVYVPVAMHLGTEARSELSMFVGPFQRRRMLRRRDPRSLGYSNRTRSVEAAAQNKPSSAVCCPIAPSQQRALVDQQQKARWPRACRRTDSGQRQMAAGALDGSGCGFLPSRALFCGGSYLQFFLHHQSFGRSKQLNTSRQSSHKKLGFCSLQGNLPHRQPTNFHPDNPSVWNRSSEL
jgi:hypothetical protein